jgi:hemerythrin-like domain-containing protein
MNTTISTQPAAGPSIIDQPDTRDMILVHRVFRREFRLLPQLVRTSPAGDRDRAAVVADWVDELCEFLHHHHTNEDELLWPRLHDRTPIDAHLIGLMERQHDVVAGLLAPIAALSNRWRTEPTVANREVLAIALDPIAVPLAEHLDLEEREVLPLVRRHLTAAEYGELGERGRASTPPSRMPIVLGAMLEEATDDERAMLLGELPLAVRAMWHTVGTRRYNAEMRRLRGGR